jgi:naphthalene 1,2-dioxygenase ferredoxin component
MGWHFAIQADQLEDEDVTQAVVEGRELAICRVKGQFFATDDECTHGQAALSEGVVVGDVLECPLHQGRFCVRTGQPRGGPVNIPLRIYPTRNEGGKVFVEIGE